MKSLNVPAVPNPPLYFRVWRLVHYFYRNLLGPRAGYDVSLAGDLMFWIGRFTFVWLARRGGAMQAGKGNARKTAAALREIERDLDRAIAGKDLWLGLQCAEKAAAIVAAGKAGR